MHMSWAGERGRADLLISCTYFSPLHSGGVCIVKSVWVITRVHTLHTHHTCIIPERVQWGGMQLDLCFEMIHINIKIIGCADGHNRRSLFLDRDVPTISILPVLRFPVPTPSHRSSCQYIKHCLQKSKSHFVQHDLLWLSSLAGEQQLGHVPDTAATGDSW